MAGVEGTPIGRRPLAPPRPSSVTPDTLAVLREIADSWEETANFLEAQHHDGGLVFSKEMITMTTRQYRWAASSLRRIAHRMESSPGSSADRAPSS